MTYSTTAQVKVKIKAIQPTDVTQDAYIDSLRDRYYDDINQRLRPYTSVPLNLATAEDGNVIIEVEALLCAGAYIMEVADSPANEVTGKGRILIDRGYELLMTYIELHFKNEASIRGIFRHTYDNNSWDDNSVGNLG